MNSKIGSLLRTAGVASLVACGSPAKPAEGPGGQDSASSTSEMPSLAPTQSETSPSTGTAGTGARETTAPREAAHDGAAAQPGAESQHAPSNGSAEPAPHAQGDPRELAAYEKAKPVFETHCARCHTTQGNKSSKSARDHFSMDSYPFGGHHASEISSQIREVLGASGAKPTMPRDNPGALSKEELQLVLAWTDAYERARSKAGSSHAH